MPSHGKSLRRQTYPNASRSSGENARKNAVGASRIRQVSRIRARGRSIGEHPKVRGPAVDPGRLRPVEIGAAAKVITRAEWRFQDPGSRDRRAEPRPPFLQEGRPERHVLGPSHRLVHTARVLHRFADPNGAPPQLDPALHLEPRARQTGAHHDRIGGPADVEVRGRDFAVHRQSGTGFGFGGSTEDVETEVVAHDSGQQARFDRAAVFGMALRVVLRGFDRGPRRRPQRIHTRALVEDLGKVPAALQHGHAEVLVLNRGGLTATIRRQHRHAAL